MHHLITNIIFLAQKGKINPALLKKTTSPFMEFLGKIGIHMLWELVLAIVFAISIGIAIWIFDIISTKIDEWEEIKKGNIGVALIISLLVLITGIIIAGVA